jgi:hypothetical protein
MADRKQAEISLRKVRSAISNGSSLLSGDVDHRSASMRRLRDLIADHASDLGGEEMLSSAERALVRRAAMLTLQTELMERNWQQNDGEASSKQIETYQRVVGALRRTLQTLGLQRRPRDVTTLGQVLRGSASRG